MFPVNKSKLLLMPLGQQVESYLVFIIIHSILIQHTKRPDNTSKERTPSILFVEEMSNLIMIIGFN